MNTGKYLANRISSAVAEHARHHGCEFFCGGSHATMLDYYRGKGFDRAVEISSNTSTRAHLLASSSNGKSTLVLSGMSSETRIKHQLLQLHFAGVDLNRIHLVGEIGAQKAQAKQSLGTVLSQLPSADSRTLFIGARWQIMEYLGKQIHGIADERPEGEGYAKLAPREHKVDSFMFDTARFSLDGRQHLVAALRMPNGDLAYDATKVFLEHGFNHVVMCGAGGRLAGELQVGDYMLLGQSQYGGENFSVARECIQVPYAGIFSDRKLNSNVTVDSPLQETERWLKENHATGSVDVETAHIFRALHERGSGIKVIPGLFVSDVVGAHPLEGKISTADAYRNLSEFVAATLRSIREHDSISTA
ncbi:hypothetical protein DIE19_34995 [Burkholderia sp. Bp9126]|nr:hypothetical protein DIE19_34995 [Burkholderia sp. Bp9126]